MFTTPLGLLGLLAVPLVALLHLFRRHHVERRISALFLWEDGQAPPTGGRRIRPPHRSPSFWLELLAALVLGLALGGPRLGGPARAAHLICVLDDSVSLTARDEEGASAAERARAVVLERLDALGAGGRVSLLRTGSPPELLAGPAAFVPEARRALAAWEPASRSHSPRAALALARQLAGDAAAVLFVTDRLDADRPLAPGAELVELVAVGRPLENTGITRAWRGAFEGGAGVFLTVVHHGERVARRRLVIELDGSILGSRDLELAPGERLPLALPLPADAGAVVLRLALPLEVAGQHDALAADDLAALPPEPARTIGLAVALEPELSAALGLGPRRPGASPGASPAASPAASPGERWATVTGDAVAVAPGEADLLLGRGGGPRTWTLELLGAETTATPRAHTGPFLCEWRHPLLAGTSFAGVRWSEDADREPRGVPLISAEGATLLAELEEPGRTRFQLDLLPGASDLQRTPDWPILLKNLVELRREALDGPRATSLSVGDDFVWRGAEPGTYELRGPREGNATPVVRELIVAPGADELRLAVPRRPGTYELRLAGGEAPVLLGVTLADGAASDLTSRGSGKRAVLATPSEVDVVDLGPTALLTGLGLLLLLADGWVLSRRDTGPGVHA